jgi:hypothetical protein
LRSPKRCSMAVGSAPAAEHHTHRTTAGPAQAAALHQKVTRPCKLQHWRHTRSRILYSLVPAGTACTTAMLPPQLHRNLLKKLLTLKDGSTHLLTE